ncbi:hypothetical protein GOODEAATRI_013421 [Goodea atripinnis]|uniref:Uncharacterized protein n=1 Tax=Goodea atripinnis TaxID=208336 RepID=A0ABV0PNC9_9TELE
MHCSKGIVCDFIQLMWSVVAIVTLYFQARNFPLCRPKICVLSLQTQVSCMHMESSFQPCLFAHMVAGVLLIPSDKYMNREPVSLQSNFVFFAIYSQVKTDKRQGKG